MGRNGEVSFKLCTICSDPIALCRLPGFQELAGDNGAGLEHNFQIE
jgi:hypothetical protein